MNDIWWSSVGHHRWNCRRRQSFRPEDRPFPALVRCRSASRRPMADEGLFFPPGTIARHRSSSKVFDAPSAIVSRAEWVYWRESRRPFRSRRSRLKEIVGKPRSTLNGGQTSFDLDDQRRLRLIPELNDRHLFVFLPTMVVHHLLHSRGIQFGQGVVGKLFAIVDALVDLFFVLDGGVLHCFGVERVDVMSVVEMSFDRSDVRKLALTHRTTVDRLSTTQLLFDRGVGRARRSLRILQGRGIRTLTNGETTGGHLGIDSAAMDFRHMLTKIAPSGVHQSTFIALKCPFICETREREDCSFWSPTPTSMLRVHVIIENILGESLVRAQGTTQLNPRNVVIVVMIDAVMHLLMLIQFVSENPARLKERTVTERWIKTYGSANSWSHLRQVTKSSSLACFFSMCCLRSALRVRTVGQYVQWNFWALVWWVSMCAFKLLLWVKRNLHT